jgi:hypothetical protein
VVFETGSPEARGTGKVDLSDLLGFTSLESADHVIQVVPDSLVEVDNRVSRLAKCGPRRQASFVIENRSPVVTIDPVLVARSGLAADVPEEA